MLTRPAKVLATLGLFCGLTFGATAGQFTPQINIQPTVPSILTPQQIKDKKNTRSYISQDFARTINSDPIFPYRADPLYTFLGFEYFYTPEIYLGVIAAYTHEKDVYSRNQIGQIYSSNVSNVSGLLPYISYLISPRWLLTGQIGGYIEDYKQKAVSTNGFVTLSRNQVFTPNAEGYVTWIGPSQSITGTIRGGFYYNNERYRSVIDNTGFFYPTRHFESLALSASARLKYYPDSHFWNAFLHVETDFRVFAGARPDIYHPDNGRQNLLYQIGPGVHFNLNSTWELRILALHTVGFGYTKEERIGIRLRAAL